jgi:hypothetical protein
MGTTAWCVTMEGGADNLRPKVGDESSVGRLLSLPSTEQCLDISCAKNRQGYPDQSGGQGLCCGNGPFRGRTEKSGRSHSR